MWVQRIGVVPDPFYCLNDNATVMSLCLTPSINSVCLPDVTIRVVSQGRLWCWVLAGHTSLIGGTPPRQPTPNRTMSFFSTTNNGTANNNAAPFFNPILPLQLNEEGIRKLDEVCLEVTEKYFRKDYADRIMDALKYSRAANKGYFRTTPDFRHFIGIYHWVKSHTNYDDYVVFRKYLQTLSAVYRWHFGHYQSVTVYNYLHEKVKIETHCEHCGSLSKALIDRLIEENLWAA